MYQNFLLLTMQNCYFTIFIHKHKTGLLNLAFIMIISFVKLLKNYIIIFIMQKIFNP